MHIHGITRHNLVVDDGRCVVLGIGALAVRIGQDRGTQHVVRVHVSPANALIDNIVQRHVGIPLHIHTDRHKHRNDASVLAQWPLALSAHAGVNQNLCHGILGRLGLFLLIGLVYSLNKVFRMVIGDELQRVRYALDQVVLADYGGHRRLIRSGLSSRGFKRV